MNQSVVLNIDESIALADEYWKALYTASVPALSVMGIKGDLPVKSLAHPLTYYNKEKGEVLADSFHNIDSSMNGKIYDFRLVGRIVDCGVNLPKNANLARYHVDSSLLLESLKLIELAWPAGYREMQAYVNGFIIVNDSGIRSLTGPTWFGAIFLGKMLFDRSRIDDMATSILHEVGHLVLYAQSAVNPPMEDITSAVYSPFVKRDRPAIMVFHAQIAMARMIIWLFSLKQFMLTNTQAQIFHDIISVPRIENAIREYGRCYLDAMDNLRLIKLTDAGLQFMNDFESIERILKALNL